MDTQKKQVADKLKEAKNVLVTVSANPSVDQLAACLGLTLMLNKLGKHAAAVFSGEVPSTIEFLKPENTLEQNTDSLRDFIIALDRSKADKLRYKVEDKVVKIFITPYKTSISQGDLEFSEGDFNVDAVVALGVKDQQDIDQAVTAHGNILHDATVITMTTSDESGLGAIHWRDPGASGVSELAASLAGDLGEKSLDEQIATAFLTGIVARTERFSNNLTSSQTMTVAAQLMSAGADQQLVATKLEAPKPPEPAVPEDLPEPVAESASSEPAAADEDDGLGILDISHERPINDDHPAAATEGSVLPDTADDKSDEKDASDVSSLNLSPLDSPPFEAEVKSEPSAPIIKPKPAPEPPQAKTDQVSSQSHNETLEDIEESVHSSHQKAEDSGTSPARSEPVQPESTIPSIHVDENGMLSHQPSQTGLRPAPGFGSGAPQPNHDHQLLSGQPDGASQNGGESPPPVPPPIV